MRSSSSRIWKQVAVSISDNKNHSTTEYSLSVLLYIFVLFIAKAAPMIYM